MMRMYTNSSPCVSSPDASREGSRAPSEADFPSKNGKLGTAEKAGGGGKGDEISDEKSHNNAPFFSPSSSLKKGGGLKDKLGGGGDGEGNSITEGGEGGNINNMNGVDENMASVHTGDQQQLSNINNSKLSGTVKVKLASSSPQWDNKAEVEVLCENPDEVVDKMLQSIVEKFPPSSLVTVEKGNPNAAASPVSASSPESNLNNLPNQKKTNKNQRLPEDQQQFHTMPHNYPTQIVPPPTGYNMMPVYPGYPASSVMYSTLPLNQQGFPTSHPTSHAHPSSLTHHLPSHTPPPTQTHPPTHSHPLTHSYHLPTHTHPQSHPISHPPLPVNTLYHLPNKSNKNNNENDNSNNINNLGHTSSSVSQSKRKEKEGTAEKGRPTSRGLPSSFTTSPSPMQNDLYNCLNQGNVLATEITRYVPKVEVREVVREVPKIKVEWVEKFVEVPEVQYVDKYEEVEQIQEVIKHVPKVEVIEVPHETIRYVPKVETKIVEQIVEVPRGEKIPVARVYPLDTTVIVPKFVDREVPVIMSQTVVPELEETDEIIEIEVAKYVPKLIPVDVYVPKPVTLPIKFVGTGEKQTPHKFNNNVNINEQQEMLQRIMHEINPHLQQLEMYNSLQQDSFVSLISQSSDLAKQHNLMPPPPIYESLCTIEQQKMTQEQMESGAANNANNDQNETQNNINNDTITSAVSSSSVNQNTTNPEVSSLLRKQSARNSSCMQSMNNTLDREGGERGEEMERKGKDERRTSRMNNNTVSRQTSLRKISSNAQQQQQAPPVPHLHHHMPMPTMTYIPSGNLPPYMDTRNNYCNVMMGQPGVVSGRPVMMDMSLAPTSAVLPPQQFGTLAQPPSSTSGTLPHPPPTAFYPYNNRYMNGGGGVPVPGGYVMPIPPNVSSSSSSPSSVQLKKSNSGQLNNTDNSCNVNVTSSKQNSNPAMSRNISRKSSVASSRNQSNINLTGNNMNSIPRPARLVSAGKR